MCFFLFIFFFNFLCSLTRVQTNLILWAISQNFVWCLVFGERRCLFYDRKKSILEKQNPPFCSAFKILTGIISRTVRDREMVSIKVKEEVIYGLSNGIILYDPRCPSEVKCQSQTPKTLKSNNSKTVRDREMASMEVE